MRINVHTIRASDKDSKDRILKQERHLISKDKGIIVWSLLCQIQYLEVWKKHSSIFKYLTCLSKLTSAFYTKLSKSTKREEKIRKYFSTRAALIWSSCFLKVFSQIIAQNILLLVCLSSGTARNSRTESWVRKTETKQGDSIPSDAMVFLWWQIYPGNLTTLSQQYL